MLNIALLPVMQFVISWQKISETYSWYTVQYCRISIIVYKAISLEPREYLFGKLKTDYVKI